MAESKIPNTNAEQLITEHLDIWTTAIEQKSSSGRGSSKKFSLHGIKKLRELILELAVRGKLVPQDPNDEPASVLLERIADEKAQLVKDKKIKKPKALPEISEDEKPFELPKGWEWSSNALLFSLIKGKKPKVLSEKNIGYPYLDIEALDRNNILRYTDDEKCPRSTDKDILVVCDGSRSGLILDGKDGVIGSTLALINAPYYLQKYIKLFFKQAFHRLNSSMKGAAIPHLDTKSLREGFMAIPPLKEQHRIAVKVDELMGLCDALEAQTENSIAAHQTLVEVLLEALLKAPEQGATPEQTAEQFQQNWQRLSEHFDTLFTTTASIDTLKQTILQLAVMGKLVPQNPVDEPAAKLLERIAAEKAQLIKDKKIKKQKPLPEITDEEKPFELPNGWEWCRVGEVINLVSGQHLKPNEYSENKIEDGVPYITGPAEFGTYYPTYSKYTKEFRALANKHDILITCKGAGLGKLNRANTTIAISRQLMAIQSLKGSLDFLFLFVDSQYNYFQSKGVGIAIPGISRGDVEELVLMLPPLEEQHRIVAKVDELMALCDQLKARLTDAQTTKLHLTDAIVEQAL